MNYSGPDLYNVKFSFNKYINLTTEINSLVENFKSKFTNTALVTEDEENLYIDIIGNKSIKEDAEFILLILNSMYYDGLMEQNFTGNKKFYKITDDQLTKIKNKN